jgi:predicted O-linked N-acetylglucosamine transferase (SPINDLY family)
MAVSRDDWATLTPVQAMHQAGALYGRGDWVRAEQLCRAVLDTQPDCFEALSLLGIIAAQTRRGEEAADLLQRAAAVKPDDAMAHNNCGNALRALRRFADALQSYQRALAIRPDDADLHYNFGNVLRDLNRHHDAADSYRRALALRPEHIACWNNLGNAQRDLGRFEDALQSYQRALALQPVNPETHNNQGNALRDLWRLEEALASYARALELTPDYAEAHSNRGNVLYELGRFAEALASYERALSIDPEKAEACNNRGNALRVLERFDEALESYGRALRSGPDVAWLRGSWLHAKMHLCEWADLGSQIGQLLDAVEHGKKASAPFFLLALTDSPALQRRAAETWESSIRRLCAASPATRKRARGEKIRVGYYSADFQGHATAYLAAGLFEEHDRRQFEVIGFSFGPVAQDDMRKRLAAAFDRFVDVRARSDQEVTQLSRDMQIDIAVDLKGFTEHARPGIFAGRAAPVQVSYLGYPGTMAASYIDYLIADRMLIPTESRRHYAEQVVYLPHSYQVNDRKRRIAERGFTRAELGLPPEGFVFCSFNNTYKVTPETFDGWMRILRQVPGSALWLLADAETAAANLRKEAAARGVSGERLVFAPHWPLPDHLARQRVADLFLDTFPCNAHTTASDALWAGLPLLTRMGDTFASRVAASLLNAVGLPELVTTEPEQYEATAIELALHPVRLAAIRGKLERNRLTAPLFDTAAFTRHLEDAYRQMYERYQGGLGPESISVRV